LIASFLLLYTVAINSFIIFEAYSDITQRKEINIHKRSLSHTMKNSKTKKFSRFANFNISVFVNNVKNLFPFNIIMVEAKKFATFLCFREFFWFQLYFFVYVYVCTCVRVCVCARAHVDLLFLSFTCLHQPQIYDSTSQCSVESAHGDVLSWRYWNKTPVKQFLETYVYLEYEHRKESEMYF
jgi:hypothetical protein